MEQESAHDTLSRQLREQAKLLKDNNRMLHDIKRQMAIGFWVRMVWFIIIIGLPFALYFYVLEPYFAAFGASYQVFVEGLNELPGLRGIDAILHSTFDDVRQ